MDWQGELWPRFTPNKQIYRGLIQRSHSGCLLQSRCWKPCLIPWKPCSSSYFYLYNPIFWFRYLLFYQNSISLSFDRSIYQFTFYPIYYTKLSLIRLTMYAYIWHVLCPISTSPYLDDKEYNVLQLSLFYTKYMKDNPYALPN